MAQSATYTFQGAGIQPAYREDLAMNLSINLAATQTLAKGTILSELSGTPGTYKAYSSAVVAAPVAAPVPTAGAGSTSYAAGTYLVAYTYTNANGETTISPTASVTLTATQQISIAALTPLPTGATGVNYYISPVAASQQVVKVAANHNDGTAAVITALPAASAPVAPQVNTCVAATDGSQNPKCILMFDCVVDGSGNITMSSTAGASGNQWGNTSKSTPAWFSGYFDISLLSGLDANGFAALGGHMLNGSVGGATGIMKF